MIYLPAKARDDWHRYTGQERTPSPGKWNRAVKGVVLKALRQLEAGCKENEYGKYLSSIVNHFTEKRACPDNFRWYCTSIEACFELFPADEFILFIQRNPNFCAVNVRRVSDVHAIAGRAEGKTIEFALLRTYWKMQPD